MITRLMVVQEIHEDGTVEVSQISSDNFQWTFDNRRKKMKQTKSIFRSVFLVI